MQTEAPPIVRDVRIDQIGFVGELQKRFVDPLKDAVKASMQQKNAPRASGDCFDGLIVVSTPSAVDVGKFLRLYERKQLTRAQFLECITVRRDAAAEYLSRADLAEISTPGLPVPQLRVSRIKTVEVSLVDAVRGLADAISGH